MVDPGASSAEIRKEVFEVFNSNMEDCDVDEDIQDVINEHLTAASPPNRITDEVLALLESSDEN